MYMKSTNEVMYGASVQLGEINIGRWRIRNQNACDLAQKKTNIICLKFHILLPQPYFHFLTVGFCICVLAY